MMRSAVTMLLACAAAYGQRPVFEVASVKPSQPGTPVRVAGGPGTGDPGRWTCVNCSLFALLHQMELFRVRFRRDLREDVDAASIQDQLGVGLEPKKGTIEMLIVDRAEKAPVEN